MTSNDSIINVETKTNRMNKMTKLPSIYLEFTLQYITLTCYNIVKDIQMTSNDSIINVETKNIRVSKMTKWHSIHLKFTLQYNTLTDYYIVNTLRIYITIYLQIIIL